MEITNEERIKLKHLIEELEKYRGRHTELVSVYIPSGYDLNKVISQLSDEQGTATNIKSSTTRKNVIDALEKMIQHLRLFKQTPKNGLAVFSGNIADQPGVSDVRVWSFEPPVPLKVRIYRCDKTFILDPLKEILSNKDIYGLIVLDRREATIAELNGKTINVLTKMKSNVPGKMRAGGQSSQRFERLREGAAKDFLKRIAEHVKDNFYNNDKIKGIIIGGPGPTKYDFVEKGYLIEPLKKKIIGIKDITYTSTFGLKELLDKSEDILQEHELINEKKLVNEFFNLLSKTPNKVVYGYDDVIKYLESGLVDKVLISEDFDFEKIKKIKELAENTKAIVNIISTETSEGKQLLNISGIAAILHYEANI